MGEIDARAKNTLAAIFLVVDRNAAHDRDLGRPIERRHVDGELGLGEGRVVLRVEEARIDHVEMDGPAASGETRGAKIERAARCEFGGERGAFRPRQQHRVAKMLADARAREHMGEEEALVDLDAVLVALRMSGFGADFLSCRDQSRNELRRGVDEIVEAAEGRAALGQAIVDLLDVGGEKRFARRARVRQQRLRAACSASFRRGFGGSLRRRAPSSGARRRRTRERRPHSRRSGPGRPRTIPAPPVLAGRRRARRKSGFRRRRHALGLLSMTRFALPSDRSICPALSTLTFAIMPMRAFIACASSLAACARASSRSDDDRAST